MEFYHKNDGYPMSISIETMSVERIDDDTCLYNSVVMDMDTNKVIAEFCHDSLLGRRKWAEGFFIGFKIKELELTNEKSILKILSDNGFLFHKENPQYRPGEGYGPPQYWTYTLEEMIVWIKKKIKINH